MRIVRRFRLEDLFSSLLESCHKSTIFGFTDKLLTNHIKTCIFLAAGECAPNAPTPLNYFYSSVCVQFCQQHGINKLRVYEYNKLASVDNHLAHRTARRRFHVVYWIGFGCVFLTVTLSYLNQYCERDACGCISGPVSTKQSWFGVLCNAVFYHLKWYTFSLTCWPCWLSVSILRRQVTIDVWLSVAIWRQGTIRSHVLQLSFGHAYQVERKTR